MINTKKISDNLNLIVKNLNEKAKEKADCTFFGGGDYDQFDYSRFAVSRPVTLNGGFHEIFIYMGNTYYSGGGALSALNQGDTKWAEYFGLGLNRSGTCSSNSTDYVKLLDPGDGSLLRASLAEKVDIDPVSYRPSFEGAVAFAAGTVFDMGDTVPYSPFTVSSFEGATTVSNGLLVLSGTWTPGDDAVAAGGTLLAADGATIRFTAGATLTLPGDDLPKSFNAHPLVACQGTGSIEGSENLAIVQSGHRWRAEWAAGGQSLNLVYIPKGTVVTFR